MNTDLTIIRVEKLLNIGLGVVSAIVFVRLLGGQDALRRAKMAGYQTTARVANAGAVRLSSIAANAHTAYNKCRNVVV